MRLYCAQRCTALTPARSCGCYLVKQRSRRVSTGVLTDPAASSNVAQPVRRTTSRAAHSSLHMFVDARLHVMWRAGRVGQRIVQRWSLLVTARHAMASRRSCGLVGNVPRAQADVVVACLAARPGTHAHQHNMHYMTSCSAYYRYEASNHIAVLTTDHEPCRRSAVTRSTRAVCRGRGRATAAEDDSGQKVLPNRSKTCVERLCQGCLQLQRCTRPCRAARPHDVQGLHSKYQHVCDEGPSYG